MCLIVQTPLMPVEEDIKVYKLIIYMDTLGWVTPYRICTAPNIGEMQVYDEPMPIDVADGVPTVTFGIHSSSSILGLLKESLIFFRSYRCKIIQCIIPKGAYSYKGIWGSYASEGYVSNKLKYKKLVLDSIMHPQFDKNCVGIFSDIDLYRFLVNKCERYINV